MNSDIVQRLRDYHDGVLDEAADMLEFFFGQMQMHSPDMGGQHSYRFRSSGWPMNHCVGANAEAAVRSAIAEIKRSQIDEKISKEKQQRLAFENWYKTKWPIRRDTSGNYIEQDVRLVWEVWQASREGMVAAPELQAPTPEKLVATWECVVTETDGDIVYCDAYSLGGTKTDNRELWEVEVSGNKWDEGCAFYVVRTVE